MKLLRHGLNSGLVLGTVGVFLLMVVPVFSATTQPGPAPSQPAAQHKSGSTIPEASSGEEKFKQNCARCHEAPQGFSPRIAGTILRHMRVRASLSAQDEREILRFLNP